jgi:alcohol dehydrogenase (NADP+)
MDNAASLPHIPENIMKYLSVAENHTIPALGLGTWKSNKGEIAAAVTEAINIGYRHIDCAPIYMNELEVGTALHAALQSGQVQRNE